MNVLDLFSGIGGFSLGLERAGMKTVAFCETDRDCRQVLKKRWPYVPIFGDVRKLTYDILKFYGIGEINLICGGFPCQDVSCCNTSGTGVIGERSGLWSEFARLIAETRPEYVLIENVPMLRSRGFCRVLADLAAIGYDAEWDIVSAFDVGAPHLRERFWVVAYPQGLGRGALSVFDAFRSENAGTIPDEDAEALSRRSANSLYIEIIERSLRKIPERVLLADGVPDEVDRHLKQYGNAVIPRIPELLGHTILNNRRTKWKNG